MLRIATPLTVPRHVATCKMNRSGTYQASLPAMTIRNSGRPFPGGCKVRSCAVTVFFAVTMAVITLGVPMLYAQGVDGDSLSGRGSASKVLSLNQVVSEVVKNNDRVAAARHMAEATERMILSAGPGEDPMLGVQKTMTIEVRSVSSCRWSESGIMHHDQRRHPAQ